MPVVINEFEVVADSRPAPPAASAGEAVGESEAAKPIEPCAVAAALRTLAAQALRVWAH